MSSCLHVSLIPARVLTVLLQVIIALPISVISANFKKNFFDHEKDKEEGLGIDGPADPAALSLRDINARSERSLEMLMNTYQQQDALALQVTTAPSAALCSLWPTEGMRRILYRLESVLEA